MNMSKNEKSNPGSRDGMILMMSGLNTSIGKLRTQIFLTAMLSSTLMPQLNSLINGVENNGKYLLLKIRLKNGSQAVNDCLKVLNDCAKNLTLVLEEYQASLELIEPENR